MVGRLICGYTTGDWSRPSLFITATSPNPIIGEIRNNKTNNRRKLK